LAFWNDVERGVPLKFTVAPETKLDPFTVSVNAPEPTNTLVGDNVVTTGVGLFTVKFTAFDVPPPGVGFVTVTGSVPPLATSTANIDAVN